MFRDADHRSRMLAAADKLEAEIDAVPSVADVGHAQYHQRVNALMTDLLQRGSDRPTTCAADHNGGRFRLHGVRATSTSGLIGAIRNWIARVRDEARKEAPL